MKCANCSNDAIYKVDPQVANVRFYCRTCLPARYFQAARAGAYDIPVEVPVEAPVKKAKKATADVTTDAPVE